VKKLKLFKFAGSGIAHGAIHGLRHRRVKNKRIRTLIQRE